MGSERGKKTRVSQDRTIRRVEREKKKKKRKNEWRTTRLRNDNAKLRDRSGKGEPRERLLLRGSLLDKSVRKWNGSRFPLSWKLGGGGVADLKKERSTTCFENASLPRNLDRRGRLWKFGTATMEIAGGCQSKWLWKNLWSTFLLRNGPILERNSRILSLRS